MRVILLSRLTDHCTLTVFERNFGAEIARMGSELEYQTSSDLSPQLSAGTPSTLNGIFGVSLNHSKGHHRNHSSNTLASSSAHLPIALPSINVVENGVPFSPKGSLSNGKSPVQLSTATYPSQALEGPLRSPRSKLTMQSDRPHVNFALPNGSKSNGRASPTPSSVPSTTAGTVTSERPTSFLSRLSSIRKKRF